MTSKPFTFKVYHAIPLYQTISDKKKASLFHLAKLLLDVANDDSKFDELDKSTLRHCSGNNRIRHCRKSFSVTKDDTLLCLVSFYPMPFPDIPKVFYFAEGMYPVISREPLFHLENASHISDVSVSMIPCQACILRPSCHSTQTFNHVHLVLEPHMDYCSTSSNLLTFFVLNISVKTHLT